MYTIQTLPGPRRNSVIQRWLLQRRHRQLMREIVGRYSTNAPVYVYVQRAIFQCDHCGRAAILRVWADTQIKSNRSWEHGPIGKYEFATDMSRDLERTCATTPGNCHLVEDINVPQLYYTGLPWGYSSDKAGYDANIY